MQTYLIQQGKLSPADSCRNISVPFELREETQQLNISFSYKPKILNDSAIAEKIMEGCINDYSSEEQEEFIKRFNENMPLNNLLTISLDDPSGFRGAVHRHLNNQHLFVRKDSATFGLIAGDIPLGKWIVTISVHSVVTENCSYKLHLWGGYDYDEEMDF